MTEIEVKYDQKVKGWKAYLITPFKRRCIGIYSTRLEAEIALNSHK